MAIGDWFRFRRRPRIGVIELRGTLASRPGALNLKSMRQPIERGFRYARGSHVILDIDSPGGSPVQSDLIANLVRRRAEERKVRVHAVIGEVGASGGYWLACAADEIHASPMSVVGSIGVVGGGFGFVGLIERIGVQRRLYTAGENKARLDPFRPERPDDIAFVKALMEELHARFKDWVRTRRAGRLKADEAVLFDGGWMLGERALSLGLVDALGDVDALTRVLGGKRPAVRVFRPRGGGLLRRLPRLLADAGLDAVEERQARLRTQPHI